MKSKSQNWTPVILWQSWYYVRMTSKRVNSWQKNWFFILSLLLYIDIPESFNPSKLQNVKAFAVSSVWTSLAHHTPQSEGKRGLVKVCTASCSATGSCRVQSDSVILSYDEMPYSACRVTRSAFMIIAFHQYNSQYTLSPDPSFFLIEGCGTQD